MTGSAVAAVVTGEPAVASSTEIEMAEPCAARPETVTVVLLPLLTGSVMETLGAAGATVSFVDASEVPAGPSLPAASVAVAVATTGPSASEVRSTLIEYAPEVACAGPLAV